MSIMDFITGELIERDEVFAVRDRTAHAVEAPLLEDEDGVVVADRRREEPLRIRRRRRDAELQARGVIDRWMNPGIRPAA